MVIPDTTDKECHFMFHMQIFIKKNGQIVDSSITSSKLLKYL